MSKMIRRDAIRTLTGGGVVAALGLGTAAASEHAAGDRSVLVQGTLTPDHAQGRRMVGFIETGIHGGHTFCSLVRQDDRNPVIHSVFAAPAVEGGLAGVRVTVDLFTEPVGDVTFSLLHAGLGRSAGTTPVVRPNRLS